MPSLCQSSVPAAPGPVAPVVKKSRFPTAVAVTIGGPTVRVPGAVDGAPNASTSVVPAGVPSLTQRLGPYSGSSVPTKSRDPTAVGFETRSLLTASGFTKSFSNVVPLAVPLLA